MFKKDVVAEILRRFPRISNLGAARIVMKENPGLFTTIGAARRRVLACRNGGWREKAFLPKTSFKQGSNHQTRDPKTIPEGKTYLDNKWEPFILKDPGNVLILADLHIPYHDRAAIETAVAYGRRHKITTLILNGDFADFFSMSFWQKDPRKRNFPEELKACVASLGYLHHQFPKARIIFKLGNHEERYIRYMETQAPVLLGIAQFELPAIFGFDQLGDITLVDDKRPIQCGDLNIIHGHEYRFAISNPVNPARGLFLRCKAHSLCGHFHQSSYHTAKTVNQHGLAAWSTGCLCDLHPDYMPMNDWCHGFARVEVARDGKFYVENKVIHGGNIY